MSAFHGIWKSCKIKLMCISADCYKKQSAFYFAKAKQGGEPFLSDHPTPIKGGTQYVFVRYQQHHFCFANRAATFPAFFDLTEVNAVGNYPPKNHRLAERHPHGRYYGKPLRRVRCSQYAGW
jgi:hypothetical protein